MTTLIGVNSQKILVLQLIDTFVPYYKLQSLIRRVFPEMRNSLSSKDLTSYILKIEELKKDKIDFFVRQVESWTQFPKIGEVAKLFHQLFHDHRVWTAPLSHRVVLFRTLCMDTSLEVRFFSLYNYRPKNLDHIFADRAAMKMNSSQQSPFATYYKMLSQNPTSSYTAGLVQEVCLQLSTREDIYRDVQLSFDFSQFLVEHRPIYLAEMVHAIKDDAAIKKGIKHVLLGSLLLSLKGYPEEHGVEKGIPVNDVRMVFNVLRSSSYLKWFPMEEFEFYYKKMTLYDSVESVHQFLLETYLYKLYHDDPAQTRLGFDSPEDKKLIGFYWERLFIASSPSIKISALPKKSKDDDEGHLDVILPFDAEIIAEAAKRVPALKNIYFKGFKIPQLSKQILVATDKMIHIDGKCSLTLKAFHAT